MPAEPGRDWVDEERAAGGAGAELRRLARRAARHKLATVGLALLVTGALLAQRYRKVRIFESRIAFRVVEGDLDAATSPRTNGALREYVSDVCFSNSRLVEVMKAHRLYPSVLARDPTEAVEAMHDDIEIEVWRNYFFESVRQADEPGRTARLAITYRGRDPKVVYETVQHLARLITEEEETSRIGQAEEALREADSTVAEARLALQRRQNELFTAELARRRAVGALAAELLVQMNDLQSLIPKLEISLQQAERTRQALHLRLELERKRLGLQFEITDAGRVAGPGLSKRVELTLVGLLGFWLALPLCLIAVGAFDARVYDAEDVRRLGLRSVGEVGAFEGDNVGALQARLGTDHGVQ